LIDTDGQMVSRLLLGRVHSKGVKKGSEDSDRRSDDAASAHWSLEGNNGSNDDDNTLDGVSNSMGDWVNL